ncbi:hypothetical protein [Pontibacillus litoralis]|uniref:Uncharacterized protein n=1 Tax=Pontibacillus litoralis JSM 072002 TaxID=1385512 RepID=A0A0A5G4J8_9BACI|nr:hypothetical protein [Pontibacillus litoralis]KGX86068.1 hypothetical protein N784_05770 [Pontibacillus litoralis JSM 072002]
MLTEVVNNKKKILLATLVLVFTLLFTVNTVYAATATAHIYPGKTSDTSSKITATKSNGSLSVVSGGPNYYVKGYAKRSINYWPDSTAASIIAYPGKSRSTNFSANSGSKYYAQANAQTGSTGVYGEAKIRF